jgi:hypothetical protein
MSLKKKEERNVSCLHSGRYKDENSRPLATSAQLKKKNDELRLYKCVRKILLPQSVAELLTIQRHLFSLWHNVTLTSNHLSYFITYKMIFYSWSLFCWRYNYVIIWQIFTYLYLYDHNNRGYLSVTLELAPLPTHVETTIVTETCLVHFVGEARQVEEPIIFL